jgi:hypothetical protein
VIVLRVLGVIVVNRLWLSLVVPHLVPLVFQPIAKRLVLGIIWDYAVLMLLLEMKKLKVVPRKGLMKATRDYKLSKAILL